MTNFTDFKTSKMLEELGFDELELTDNFYNGEGEFNKRKGMPPFEIVADDEIHAPLWQQVKEWLFENYNIWIVTIRWHGTKNYDFRCWDKDGAFLEDDKVKTPFNSYIIAEIEGIKKSVEYLYDKKNREDLVEYRKKNSIFHGSGVGIQKL